MTSILLSLLLPRRSTSLDTQSAFPLLFILFVTTTGCQQSDSEVADTTGGQSAQEQAAKKNDEPSSLPSEFTEDGDHASHDGQTENAEHHYGPGRGMMGQGGTGRGPGGMGPGMMAGNREDMMTLHALFDGSDKIERTIRNLSNGAETLTQSDDEQIASLIQEHVAAMETRVEENSPLPPMRFHPLFKELIKNGDKVDFQYESTDKGLKVTYTSDDPHVVVLIQEHAKLVSRFIKNGMEEIHKPYEIPSAGSDSSPDNGDPVSEETEK